MTRIGRLFVPSVVAALVIISWPSVATAQPAGFRSAPAAGVPETVITVTAVAPCKSPVAGTPFVRVFLQRGGETLGSTIVAVAPSGTWSGSLRVGGASPGPAQLNAFCFANRQAEGALLVYQPNAFAVLGATAAPSGLPATGFPTILLLTFDSCLFLCGIAMLMASTKRRFGQTAR